MITNYKGNLKEKLDGIGRYNFNLITNNYKGDLKEKLDGIGRYNFNLITNNKGNLKEQIVE